MSVKKIREYIYDYERGHPREKGLLKVLHAMANEIETIAADAESAYKMATPSERRD